MWATPTLLVVCTANVCRSVYAADLLRRSLAGVGVDVRSAGLETEPGMTTCQLVEERLSEDGGLTTGHTPRRLTPDDLRASSLVLTMTAAQRSEVNRLYWAGREHTFTVVEATTIARSLPSSDRQERGHTNLDAFVAELIARRGMVPMPVSARTGFKWPWPASPEVMIDIPDGHNSRRYADHVDTLDRVASEASDLAVAIRDAMRPL